MLESSIYLVTLAGVEPDLLATVGGQKKHVSSSCVCLLCSVHGTANDATTRGAVVDVWRPG